MVRGVQLGRATTAARCRHNLGYWRGADWWGVGPGAHSHVGGVRWWNVKHPVGVRRPAGGRPRARRTPGSCWTTETRRVERVLLELRLSEGLDLSVLDVPGRRAVPAVVDRGLAVIEGERLVLTREGRLLADGVVRELVP